MTGLKTFFTEYESKIPSDMPARQAPPPENVPVLIRCASISKHEIEGMLVRAHGRSGLRWQLFSIPGHSNRVDVHFCHQAGGDAWRTKHRMVPGT
jgi:hypothetical protein